MLLVVLSINTSYCTDDAVIAKVPVVMYRSLAQRPFPSLLSIAVFRHDFNSSMSWAGADLSGLLPF
jgi:hypothetical protein